MSLAQGYPVSSSTQQPNGSNPQYSPLNTEQTNPRRQQRRSDEVLDQYVENFLKNNKILSALHNFRTKVVKTYNPISTLALAIVFFFSRRVTIDENCKGRADYWTFIGFLYFSVMTIVEIASFIQRKGGLKGIKKFFENPILKPLSPVVNGADILTNMGINIGILYAFLEKDECPVLSPYLNWWAVIEFIPMVCLCITLALTVVTMITYLHYEKKRLD